MANPIVTVNVTQQVAPTPSALQKKGAFISQGGTTLATNATAFLTQASDLTPLLAAALALTSLSWSGGTATATTSAPHGITSGDTFLTTIAGATPANYNGTYLATVTGASTFTYALASDGGTTPATGSITYTPRNVAELVAEATTFFAQGSSQGVYVLELGAGEPSAGVTALGTYIAAQPTQPFYAYLVPRAWNGVSSFLTFLAGFTSNTAKTYFFVTTTTGTYTDYAATLKCVYATVEAPGVSTTEFTAAADFYRLLNYSPSSTNKVTPFAFGYDFAVTPYPTVGNNTTLAALAAAFVNVIGTGAEGGISNTICLYGTTMDGNDLTYWYSVDWVQINLDLNVSNAVINGSNNPANPLYYNQPGIDQLQDVAAATMSSGVTFGLVLGAISKTNFDGTTFPQQLSAGAFTGLTDVNAVPFVPYSKANPSDYKVGRYAGFTVVYTPARGFKSIVFNLIVTQFVTQ